MFKPFKGPCVNCGHDRWILVSKGLCKQCNDDKRGKTRIRPLPKRSNVLRGEIPGDKIKARIFQSGYRKKSPSKQAPIKKGAPKKRFRKPTGEAQIFAEIFEEALQEAAPECPRCRLCSIPLGFTPRPIFFSHILGKLTYVVFRKWKLNIWLICEKCHKQWHETGRSDLPGYFRAKIYTEQLLKRFYYFTRSIVNYDYYSRLPESIEEVERIIEGDENDQCEN